MRSATPLRSVRPEDVGQDVCEILEQMKPIRYLAGGGGPKARRFRVRLGPIPHVHLDPGMGLKPLGDGRGFPVGQQGQGPPPQKVQQERAIRVTLP
jgi:hypothetical protein